MKPVLLDTGVIVALLDRSDRSHRRCVAALENVDGPLVTCEPVIAEACYLLRSISGAAEAVLDNVFNGGFRIGLQLADSASAITRIIRKYRDIEIDLADACLVHLATVLNTGRILTLDSDFNLYRWATNRRFENLVPAE